MSSTSSFSSIRGVRPPKIRTVTRTMSRVTEKMTAPASSPTSSVDFMASAKAMAPRRPENHRKIWCLREIFDSGDLRRLTRATPGSTLHTRAASIPKKAMMNITHMPLFFSKHEGGERGSR